MYNRVGKRKESIIPNVLGISSKNNRRFGQRTPILASRTKGDITGHLELSDKKK